MAPLTAPEREARRLLDLTRSDREAARAFLRGLSVDDFSEDFYDDFVPDNSFLIHL